MQALFLRCWKLPSELKVNCKCVLCKCVLQESYEQSSIFRSERIYECVFTCLCLIMHLQQMFLSLFTGRWIGVVCMSVHVCVCACLWPAIKTMAPLRAFLGRLTETLMASDWINHACRRYTHTTHTHSHTRKNTHTHFHDPCSPMQRFFSLTLILCYRSDWTRRSSLC